MNLDRKMICFHPPCLNYIPSSDKYCFNHKEKNMKNLKFI